MVCARHAYAVHHLCMFANNPSEKHWKQAQHVLKYLKYHVDNNDGSKQVMPLGIKYTASKNQDLEGFVDASFADNYGTDDDNRRSTTGWCFMSGGGAVSISSEGIRCSGPGHEPPSTEKEKGTSSRFVFANC